MRPELGDDYCIACCVSGMRVGKDMQFFGARANLAKCLLYAINGGKDEIIKDKAGNPMQVSPVFAAVEGDGKLDFNDVKQKFEQMMDWLAGLYVNVLNLIHYMHDKYSYEALEMALHDTQVRRFFATGVAGLSCAADSLSAIKYASVYPVRNADGIVTDFKIEGDYPKYGNNDDSLARKDIYEQNQEPLYLPRKRAYYVHSDHNEQRRLRQKYGQHSGRQKGGATARTRCEPYARQRLLRRARVARKRCKAALRVFARRDIEYFLRYARISRQGRKG